MKTQIIHALKTAALATMAIVGLSTSTQAQLVISSTNRIITSGSVAVNSDVLAEAYGGVNPVANSANIAGTSTISLTSGSTYEGLLGNINDGLMVSSVVPPGYIENSGNSLSFITGSSPGDATLVFDLGGFYDIAKIETYTNWRDERTGQKYTVYTSGDGGSSWTSLASVSYDNYSVEGFTWVSHQVTIEDSILGSSIANGVNAVRFDFTAPGGGPIFGGIASEYSEIGIYAVPEPSTLALLACSSMALIFLRRRRRAA